LVKFDFKTKAQSKRLSTDEDLQKSVKEFYKSDTVSRQMPGEKDFVEGEKKRCRKKFLS